MFSTNNAIGVPSVLPLNVPETMRTLSPSSLWVTIFDCSRTTAIQLRLNVFLAQRDARRTAINHHADAATVAFAPSGYAENFTKRIPHAPNPATKAAVLQSDGL